jgi:hypothetical protein
MVRRLLILLLLAPVAGVPATSAQAATPPVVLYQGSATATQAELNLLIPSDLGPGFQSITVTVVNKEQTATEKTYYFCKTLTGEIHWNNQCPDATITASQATLEAVTLRSKLPKYNPRSEPKRTTDLVIASFAALTVASTTRILTAKSPTPNASKQQGYLSQVAKGGLLLSAIALGPGDRLRERRTKSSASGTRFTSLANRSSAASPLLARILGDGNYLRASLQNWALLLYPFALGLGLMATRSVHFQAIPPSMTYLLVFLALGIMDSFAGLLSILTFSLLAIATGHVTSLSEFLSLVGFGLVGFSPILLASVFRPLRRSTFDFSSYWERLADYLVASILTGWVVKQIILGLSGLSGLQLPITVHAHTIGIIAAALVATRYALEDFVSYLFPGRIAAIEPTYREQSTRQYLMRITMQIIVFLLVAEPFLGNSASLWIGLSIFTVPLLLSLLQSRLPHSVFLGRWIPKGIIEMITMTTAGFLIARALNWYPQSATGYVLTAFILLGIPGFILKILPLFAAEPTDQWRQSKGGAWSYRIGGVIALVALGFIVSTGILFSNNL